MDKLYNSDCLICGGGSFGINPELFRNVRQWHEAGHPSRTPSPLFKPKPRPDPINILTKLRNFNFLKYTDHYVLTIDGRDGVIIFQGSDPEQVLRDVSDWLEKIK